MSEPACELTPASDPVRESSLFDAAERTLAASNDRIPVIRLSGELAMLGSPQTTSVREYLYEAARRSVLGTGGELPGTAPIAVISPSCRLSPGEQELAGRYLQLRHAYVTAMGWVKGSGSDEDAYDQNPGTRYIVKKSRSESSLVCGLRFTPTPTLEDSLTWSMLAHRPEVQASIVTEHGEAVRQLQTAARGGRLWDLTRLVPQMDGSASISDIVTGMHELFGAALAETTQGDQRPLWLFLTTESFRGLLVKSGIEHETLYTGKVNDQDAEESFLCVTDPLQAYVQLARATNLRHRAASAALSRGLVDRLD